MDDDFDKLFGEKPPPSAISNANGYGSWLPVESTARPLTNSKPDPRNTLEHSMSEILARKPPPISPTLPKLEGDLACLQNDPLDLDQLPAPAPQKDCKRSRAAASPSRPDASKAASAVKKSHSIPEVGLSGRRAAATVDKLGKPLVVGGRNQNCSPTKGTRERSSSSTIAHSASDEGMTRSKAVGLGKRLEDHFASMKELHEREQFSDTIDEWKGIIARIDRLEVIEMAKRPRDERSISALALTVAWIAEHLVDLLLKRIQLKVVTKIDSTSLIAELAVISALREQARHSHLRALHMNPELGAAVGAHLSLSAFIVELLKKI